MRHAGGRPRLVGFSGTDGAGKTALVAAVREQASREGLTVRSAHLYGCFLCRRVPAGRASGGRRSSSRWVRAAARVHVWVDALELWLRLRAPGRADLFLTDRSPLDALVKHDPGPGSGAARFLFKLLGRYDRVFWVDAEPEIAAERDGEHSPAEIESARGRFSTWSARFGAVVRVDGGRPADTVAAEVGIAVGTAHAV